MKSSKKRILVVFGTRPEALKLFPLFQVPALGDFELISISTGQQREMLFETLSDLKWTPDIQLDLMQNNQTYLSSLIRISEALDIEIAKYDFDAVLVQGDTTTALAASLVALNRQKPIFHLEAGLRSGNLLEPWPEEANRRMIDQIATLHFPPTLSNLSTLSSEGLVQSEKVYGNTSMDMIRLKLADLPKSSLSESTKRKLHWEPSDGWILVTHHRRESFGKGIYAVLEAIKMLVALGHRVLFPIHLNPNVRAAVDSTLRESENLSLIDPLPYSNFVDVLRFSKLVITDSGGIQEECAALKTPILITRQVTERQELLSENNLSSVVGYSSSEIVSRAISFLERSSDSVLPRIFTSNAFGDGQSASLVLSRISTFFNTRNSNA